jgi:hypothetical protein
MVIFEGLAAEQSPHDHGDLGTVAPSTPLEPHDQVDLLRPASRRPKLGGAGARRCPKLVVMGLMELMATRVAAGETVEFRPTGSSMVPLIRSRQVVTVSPVDPAALEVGDIVLCRVAGATYLHLVSAVDARGRVQISNNRGRINGWTSHLKVFGICTTVDGVRRPRLDGKLRS